MITFFFVEIITKICAGQCVGVKGISLLSGHCRVYSNLFQRNRSFDLGNDQVVSSGLAYKYSMQCTCAEDYNVYKNKIYILNVRIDPESAFSKLLVVFLYGVFPQ